jgi:hypothetical protein
MGHHLFDLVPCLRPRPARVPHVAPPFPRASLPSRRIHPLPGRAPLLGHAPHPSASALVPGRRARDRLHHLRISCRPRAPHRVRAGAPSPPCRAGVIDVAIAHRFSTPRDNGRHLALRHP